VQLTVLPESLATGWPHCQELPRANADSAALGLARLQLLSQLALHMFSGQVKLTDVAMLALSGNDAALIGRSSPGLGRQHAKHEQLRGAGKGLGPGNATSNGLCDGPSQQHGTQELKNGSNDNS